MVCTHVGMYRAKHASAQAHEIVIIRESDAGLHTNGSEPKETSTRGKRAHPLAMARAHGLALRPGARIQCRGRGTSGCTNASACMRAQSSPCDPKGRVTHHSKVAHDAATGAATTCLEVDRWYTGGFLNKRSRA